jgi:outer membrane protein TolC
MKSVLQNILVLGLMIVMSSSFAQKQTVTFSLKDAIRIAQQQSPDALMAKHRFRSSYWQFRTYRATYMPGLKFDATIPNLNRSIEAITMPDGSSDYVPRSLIDYSATLSVSQRVGWTGGEVFLNTGIQQITNFYSDTTTKQFLADMVSIGFRQPIFTYNEYKWDKKIEPLKYEEAQRKYLEDNEQVAITAINRFFNLLTAQIEMEIAKKNYANYDTLYKIAKGRFNLGKIAENELLQLELNLLKADASLEQSQLNYNNMLFLFKSYLRLKTDGEIRLIPPVVTNYFDIPLNRAVEEAKANTSSGLEFQRRLLEAESEVNRAKMTGRFDANLYASFGLTQTADYLSDAYKNPLDQERVTLGITLPILDWGRARGNIRMAESNHDLVVTSVEQDKIDFEQDIYLQVMQFGMQKKQLYIAAKSDTVAKKRYDVTYKRYMIGKVNDVLELNNAQIDNDNANMGYIRSLRDYWVNYYKIRKMTLYDFENQLPVSVNFDGIIGN